MIMLKGLMYGKSIKIECENEDICAAFQYRLNDLLDICDKEGCQKNCKYIVRKPEDKPFFVCDVNTKKCGSET